MISCHKDKSILTDEEKHILELAYSTNYKYPTEFYDETSDTIGIYYVNTLSITPVAKREHIRIDLHTNDISIAKIWSDKTSENSSVQTEIISQRQTEKFFEFKRKNILNGNDIMLSRVHKTSYFRPVLDKFNKRDSIGFFNGTMDLERIKDLVEYLWINNSTGVYYTKVLESKTTEFQNHFEHYIKSITFVGGDRGINDMIHVYDNFFTINKLDRKVKLISKETKLIQGREN